MVKIASEIAPPATIEEWLREYLPGEEVPSDMEAFMWPVDVMADAQEALVQPTGSTPAATQKSIKEIPNGNAQKKDSLPKDMFLSRFDAIPSK